MTMEFLELSTVAGDGVGNSVSRMRTFGLGFAIVEGSGYGSSELGFWSAGLLVGGGEVAPPAIPALGHSESFMRTEGAAYSRIVGEGGGSVSSMGTTRGQQGAMGASNTPIQTSGYVTPNLSAYGFLATRAPIISSFGDQWFQVLQEGISLTGQPSRVPTAVMREVVALQFGRSARYEGTHRITDTATFGANLSWIITLLVQEGIAINGEATGSFTQLIRVVARLIASGRATGIADALVQLVDGIVLLAMQDALNKADVTDTVRMGAVLDSLYAAIGRAVARVVLQANATGEQQMVVVLRDAVLMNADLSNEVDLVMLLREAVGFAATLSFDNGEYIAWVLNTESKGLSRYTNYPFNSMTQVGSRYYGAASDGLHRLEGDSDNGEDIHAFIRAGLSDYGTRLGKRMPECFIGYTSNGTLVLRVINVDENGQKVSAHYRLPMRGAANKQGNRFKIGRGLKAIDWAFELHNVDGSDFDISSVQFRPIVVSRRTRGK